jgi:hypothetical protein
MRLLTKIHASHAAFIHLLTPSTSTSIHCEEIMSNSEDLARFYERHDVDKRMQGAVAALAKYTGIEHPWLTKFFALLATPGGEEQLRGLWIEFLEVLEESQPTYAIPMVLLMQCQIPQSNPRLKRISGRKLFEWGSTLITQTVEQTWVVSEGRMPGLLAEVAANVAKMLVNVLEAKINPPAPYS